MKDIVSVTGAIASGDPQAFARLYRAKFNFVLTVARRITSFGEDACLDVVQDTMIRVIRYMRIFEDGNALDRWLICLTRSVAYDHLRVERRRQQRERASVDHQSMYASDEPDDVAARLEWVRRELRGLDRVAAEIIELRFRGGLTLKVIAERLGMTIGAVHGRMARSIARLRRRANEQRDE